MIGRALGAVYLTAGCVWVWRFSLALSAARWSGVHVEIAALARSFGRRVPRPLVLSCVLAAWLLDGAVEIAFWPLGARREWRFRRYLRAHGVR